MSTYLAFRRSLDLSLNPRTTYSHFQALTDKTLLRKEDFYRLLVYAHGYRITPIGDNNGRLSTVKYLENESLKSGVRLDKPSVKMVLDTYARSGAIDDMYRVSKEYGITVEPVRVLMAKTVAGVVLAEEERTKLFDKSVKQYGESRVKLMLSNALKGSAGKISDQLDRLKSTRDGSDSTYKHTIRYLSITL
jgi:hypothetical protein